MAGQRNSFIEGELPSAAEPGEFALRPLRIQKRTEKAEKHEFPENPEKPDRPDKTERTDKPGVGAQKSAGTEEFVCRPMRLGSSAAPSRRWSLEKTDPKELKEVKQSVDQRHSKDIFYELQKQHEEYKDKRDYNDDTEHKEVFTDETTAVSSPLSTWDTPSTAQSKYSSIQIKNLPIEPSQKRVNVPEPASAEDMIFAVCLVDFHHVRGPEVQWWRSNYHTSLEPEADINLFKNLAFQALPDGSHLFEETFSNFNLVYDFATRSSLDDSADIEAFKGNPNRLETLFGCSCVRQVKTTDLSETELERNKDITRSIVQKAVVVISRKQPVFTKIKEKLSIITQSFFQQDSFGNFELLESLFDNLNESFRVRDAEEITAAQSAQPKDPESQLEPENYEEQEEYFVNLNLRQLLSQFKNEILVILKALLLEKKVLVYSNNNLELLTQFQNNMIALIPNLINSLELSGCPLCDYTEKHSPLEKPTTLKTNDRMSMLRFFGLPLQVFNTKGSFWNPYLPLPQMEELNSRSFMVGCSNLLIVNQSAHFKVDLLVDLDAWSVTFPSGKGEELRLTPLDKKFISVLLASHTSREAYVGSDDYIRYQFEDYIRSLLATTRFHQYVERFKLPPPGFDIQTDKQLGSVAAFKQEFITQWQQTKNYHIWNATCDEFIFNFHSPKHLATEMNDPGAAYNLSGFLSSFKKAPPQPATTLTDKANQYFSHVQQPRKYIASDEQKETSPDLQSSESVPKDSTRSAWSWGFKKS